MGSERTPDLDLPALRAVIAGVRQWSPSVLAEEARTLASACERLAEENERMREAIRWALGERGDFSMLPEGRSPNDGKAPHVGLYWWRTDLRKRAGMDTPAPAGKGGQP